ncbi:MAG: glycosyltransferase, partial [Anaerolineaceae bacterium]|nr:glycosyltransferase [Anaerolineaceae bacterium]
MKSVVVHLITGLDTGGAEVMLFRLLTTIDQQRFHSQVISLTNVGAMGERIRQLGIPVQALGMRPGVPHPLAVLRLSRWLRQSKPALVQTWMYHADLIGGLAAWLADVPVVWNIRHSDLNPAHIKRSTIWVARVCAWLSRWLPAAIVVNSENAKRIHVGMGYRHEKMVFIPNGFDLEQFQPDPPVGCALRRQLDLEDGVPVVGMAARYHPQKDHRTFVQAATLLCERMPEARFL